MSFSLGIFDPFICLTIYKKELVLLRASIKLVILPHHVIRV